MRDVLQLAQTDVLHRQIELRPDLLVHGLRETDAPGLRQRLEARRNVHAVAVEVLRTGRARCRPRAPRRSSDLAQATSTWSASRAGRAYDTAGGGINGKSLRPCCHAANQPMDDRQTMPRDTYGAAQHPDRSGQQACWY